jgi:hypothetical protein
MPSYPINVPANLPNAPADIQAPLQGVPGAFQGGMSLGLQQRQIQALEQERQIQLQTAQLAAQQAKKTNDIAALGALRSNYDLIKGDYPDQAFDLYQTKIAPFMSAILRDQGINADFQTNANPNHENADSVKVITKAVSDFASGNIDEPTFQKVMAGEQMKHSPEGYVAKRIGEAQKSGTSIQDYNKHQDELEQQARQQIAATRGDQNFQKLELQRNGAAATYDLLRKNQKQDGSYDLTKQQLVDLNSKLYTALNGTGPTDTSMKELNQSSVQSLYSTLASRVGLARNALPREIGDRILKMSDDAGSFAEAQHTQMLSGKLNANTGLEPARRQNILNEVSPRGFTFQEMKSKADAASKYQPNNQRIRVINKATGQTGTISSSNFDPNRYTQVK